MPVGRLFNATMANKACWGYRTCGISTHTGRSWLLWAHWQLQCLWYFLLFRVKDARSFHEMDQHWVGSAITQWYSIRVRFAPETYLYIWSVSAPSSHFYEIKVLNYSEHGIWGDTHVFLPLIRLEKVVQQHLYLPKWWECTKLAIWSLIQIHRWTKSSACRILPIGFALSIEY